MAIQLISSSSSSSVVLNILQNNSKLFPSYTASSNICFTKRFRNRFRIGCSKEPIPTLRTCRNCKTQFDPLRNHPRACLYHTAHFGGETKRKFESVHSGGTMSTPDSGKVFQYWHCCGSEDPFDLGCTAAPHLSYDE